MSSIANDRTTGVKFVSHFWETNVRYDHIPKINKSEIDYIKNKRKDYYCILLCFTLLSSKQSSEFVGYIKQETYTASCHWLIVGIGSH